MPRPRRMTSKKAPIKGIIEGYRSGLEEKLAEQLLEAGIEVRYESIKIPYEKPASKHRYTPADRKSVV